MQYVRSLGGSVSKTWNSINPATLSGAVDVIVVEQEDGSLACSPFHVRFGKFSLLRPSEKKVEFRVNDIKRDIAMKLGEGGEAFFVLETSEKVPESLQTSPVVSPIASPLAPTEDEIAAQLDLQEPEFLDLNLDVHAPLRSNTSTGGGSADLFKSVEQQDDVSAVSSGIVSARLAESTGIGAALHPTATFPSIKRSISDEILGRPSQSGDYLFGPSSNVAGSHDSFSGGYASTGEAYPPPRSHSPPAVADEVALARAKALSERLWVSRIPSLITEDGNLMIDMADQKVREEDALRAEIVARKILSEELEGNYDIGSLIGADQQGNIWIYKSEAAKEEAAARPVHTSNGFLDDAASDPGHQSDEDSNPRTEFSHHRTRSDVQPDSPVIVAKSATALESKDDEQSKNYAKTLRLTGEQLRALDLSPGANSISFSVNRATCQAHMYYWKDENPIVISDIDGTITKSDALGHVLNMIGRDWTHLGVAKLYTDITANGYHLLYLTSRSVGQADSTRAYLNGVSQEGFKLPRGPVIMSPDRTMVALRREIYLRKPEVFKMACLRELSKLFSQQKVPFYAGFGNRFTDALSYRSVNIPSSRIFTINSEAEVSLDLLSLNKYKSSYVTMREIVDHFFPPVGLLVTGGGEAFTDFNYWRDPAPEVDDFDDSDSESDEHLSDNNSIRSEDEGSDLSNEDANETMGESFLSTASDMDSDAVSRIEAARETDRATLG